MLAVEVFVKNQAISILLRAYQLGDQDELLTTKMNESTSFQIATMKGIATS